MRSRAPAASSRPAPAWFRGSERRPQVAARRVTGPLTTRPYLWNTREGDAGYDPRVNVQLAPSGTQAIDFADLMSFISVWNLRL